jgi:hypothetical protein
LTYGKTVGVGNTATVYEWGTNKVLKLFYKGYPREVVECEFSNALAVRLLDFDKPKAYELLTMEDRLEIVYDKVEGEALSDADGCHKRNDSELSIGYSDSQIRRMPV